MVLRADFLDLGSLRDMGRPASPLSITGTPAQSLQVSPTTSYTLDTPFDPNAFVGPVNPGTSVTPASALKLATSDQSTTSTTDGIETLKINLRDTPTTLTTPTATLNIADYPYGGGLTLADTTTPEERDSRLDLALGATVRLPTIEDIVQTTAYSTVGEALDPSGVAYYADKLRSGELNTESLARDIAYGAQTTPQQLKANEFLRDELGYDYFMLGGKDDVDLSGVSEDVIQKIQGAAKSILGEELQSDRVLQLATELAEGRLNDQTLVGELAYNAVGPEQQARANTILGYNYHEVDPVTQLRTQIADQYNMISSTGGYSYQGRKSDLDKIFDAEAKKLADAGVTSIYSLGLEEVPQTKEVVGIKPYKDGYYYEIDHGEGAIERVMVSADEVLDVREETSTYFDGETGQEVAGPTRLVATIATTPEKYLVNKDTGERVKQITSKNGLERWGTSTGVEGQAHYGLTFDQNGTPIMLPVYEDTASDLTPYVMIASAMLGPYATAIGETLGATTLAGQTALGATAISAGAQLLTTGKIDPIQTALTYGTAYVGTTGPFTADDIAFEAARLTQDYSPSVVASTLESMGVNSVTANIAAQVSSVGIPAEVAPMVTSGLTNGGLLGLEAIANNGDIGQAFQNGFLTGASGEAGSFAVSRILGEDTLRKIAETTSLTPNQVNAIAAQGITQGLNAEVLKTGNFFDVFVDTAIASGVGEATANKIRDALSEKLSPKQVAALSSMGRDALSVTTSALMNNRDPNAALDASMISIVANAASAVAQAPSQEAVDEARRTRIEAEAKNVELSALSENPAAVEAYQNALGDGKSQEDAIQAAKIAVATERVDAKVDTTQPKTIVDETGKNVEVFPVPSWNIAENKINPKPVEHVYRDASGNVFVDVKQGNTTVSMSMPQFLATTGGITTQAAAELTQSLYNGVRMVGGLSPDSAFSRMLDEVQETGAKMESPEIQAGKAEISRRLHEAEGWDILKELVLSSKDNPTAALSYLSKELLQEFPIIGTASKISKAYGLIAALSFDAAANGLEGGGASIKQAYEQAIKEGKTPEEAQAIAFDVGITGMALAAGLGSAIDYGFLKGLSKSGVSTANKSATQVAKEVAESTVKATAKEAPVEATEEGTVALLSDFMITGSVDWNNTFRQGGFGGWYGGHTAGSVQLGSSINASTGTSATNLQALDPAGAPEHISMINETLSTSPNAVAAANSISVNLQNSGMSVAQANNVANTAIAESIVTDVNNNAQGSFAIGDLNTVVGINSTGDAVTLGDMIGSNFSNLGTDIQVNPHAVIGTDVDNTTLTIQDVSNLSSSINLDSTTTTDPNTGTETNASTDVNTETGVVTESNVETNPNTNSQTETNTEIDTNTNTVTQTNTNTNTETNTQTETTTETNVDTNTQTTTNTETNIDTGDSTTTTEESTPTPEEEEEAVDALMRGQAATASLYGIANPATSKILLPEETWLGGKPRPPSKLLDLYKQFNPKDTVEMQDQEIYSALRRAAGLESAPAARPLISEPSFYSYGTETSPQATLKGFKRGGTVQDPILDDTISLSPLLMSSGDAVEHKGSHYVQGAGGGQDDLIPAKLADGEYVFDAEIVAALGDGSNKEGARRLDKMREEIRKHKRGGSTKSIPPKAKNPLAYLRSAK